MVVVVASLAGLGGCALGSVATSTLRSEQIAAANDALKSDLLDAEVATLTYSVAHDGSASGVTLAELVSSGFKTNEIPAKFRIVVSSDGTKSCAQGATKFGQVSHVTERGSFSTGPCPAL